MANKNTAPDETVVDDETVAEINEVSAAAQATRDAIRDRPRQSPVRYLEHYVTIKTLAPEELEERFTAEELVLLEEHAHRVTNKVQEFRDKSDANQLSISRNATSNENEQTGYAGYIFDEAAVEALEDKLREKTPREKKDVVDKAKDLFSKPIPEDKREELLALLREQGFEV